MAVRQDRTGAGDAIGGATVAFVLEQTLGHVTHSKNLHRLAPAAAAGEGLRCEFVPIPFELGRAARVPGWSNWTIRAGIRARSALRNLRRRRQVDAMFVHTLVPATLLGGALCRIPTVVSLDATPKQYDDLGEFYLHDRGPEPVERIKHRLHSRTFANARRLVTWSSWTRDDLVERYGIDPGKITVIPPGVDVGLWEVGPTADSDRPLQVLFVGGDLERKGGNLLIEACERLRVSDDVPPFELHLVTTASVEPAEGVVVHGGLTPNSPGLLQRFRDADVFCLPTYGDCLPLVLAEAGASGLPLVSTDVGAIGEIVQRGVTGELIDPGDVDGLTEALRTLLTKPDRRRQYGEAARDLVVREHNAEANAIRLLGIVASMLDER